MAFGVVSLLKLQKPVNLPTNETVKKGRPLKEIIKNKDTILALLSSATAFVVMGMAMTTTPIAMHGFGHLPDSPATVIQWHVLGMFLPSFFTGMLIEVWGVPHHIHRDFAIVFIPHYCRYRNQFHKFRNSFVHRRIGLELSVHR